MSKLIINRCVCNKCRKTLVRKLPPAICEKPPDKSNPFEKQIFKQKVFQSLLKAAQNKKYYSDENIIKGGVKNTNQ